MTLVHLPTLLFCVSFILISAVKTCAQDAIIFTRPTDSDSQSRVLRASTWLVNHIVRGKLRENPELGEVSVVAWHDPTLAPGDPSKLAGYTITDTLWASKALTIEAPDKAKELGHSLARLDCLENGLQEVLFQPIAQICHRPGDLDPVHGSRLGSLILGDVTVDVRTFRMKYDADYSLGHPALFAEHRIYQALFDYWNGQERQAKERITSILTPPKGTRPTVFWDRERGILVDFTNIREYQDFIDGESHSCRQATFKIALLAYAIRLMEIADVDDSVRERILKTVWSAQHETGGLAHFIDTTDRGDPIPTSGATAEATSIAILSQTVVRTGAVSLQQLPR